MRSRPGRRRWRHHDDAADPGEGATSNRRPVAIGAAAAQAGVVHLAARETRVIGERGLHVAVAALRWIAARNVIGRHAGRDATVVACGASAQVTAQRVMREGAHRNKRRGRMADLARHRGRDMVGRLARRPRAVVASPAATGPDRRVSEHHRAKGADVVTAVAAAADLNVPERHGHGAALVVHDMAPAAFFRRALEDALDVTGFTAHLLMGAQQLERSRRMVKADPGLGLGSGHRHRQQQTQERQHECQRAHLAVRRTGLAWVHHDGDLGRSGDGRTGSGTGRTGGTEAGRPSCAAVFCFTSLNEVVTWHCWQRRPKPA